MTPALRDELLQAPARFSRRILVTFGDVDAAGFVFFARTCAFFHDAYTEMRRKRGEPIAEYRSKPASRVLGVEADYLRPMRAGDEVDVLVVSSSFEADGAEGGKAVVGFRIVNAAGEALAVGTISHTSAAPVELPASAG
jgi:acyl-CoA thioesterase FadM